MDGESLDGESPYSKNVQCTMMQSLPNGYKSECVQKYGERRLMALNEYKNKSIIVERFPFPSCCKCIIKRV